MFPLPSPSSLMMSEFVPSTLSPRLSGDSEEKENEVSSGSSNKECDERGINEDRKEATENSEHRIEEPREGMIFDTPKEAYLYYSRYAEEKGFVVAKRNSRKGRDGNLSHVTFQCNRGGKANVTRTNSIKPRPQTKIECPARLNLSICLDGKWRLNRVALEHNHENSPKKSTFQKSNKIVNGHVKRKVLLKDKVGIMLHKTSDSLQGHENLPFLPKDCQNDLDKMRLLRLVEGDVEAMNNYFMRMTADNSEFFFAMDLDDEGRLTNVFWADARSRAACKEFGDVVTFDTTYLVNKYDMPFAPFVGVNHHGQLVLMGCALVSHEDTKSFSWLFKTWMTCMRGCAPKTIITDQCVGMKNAIGEVFPNTRHRWCTRHILKKVAEKLGKCEAYKSILSSLHSAVYDSLKIEDFEDAWDAFIKKYELQNNEWLHGLYLERTSWVPVFVKDVLCAGMSSTQRSESMNPYFHGYINSKTTLKQFVEQYENALARKVEDEKHEDAKSFHSYIPCITQDELEKQFKSAYTIAKAKEFHGEFIGKLGCLVNVRKAGDVWSEYEVKEDIKFGEEKKRKRVSFIVDFNGETNEANCNCQLFEFRGMVCRHQLMVFYERDVERVPEKYVLRRWRKNLKRVHSKIRINYDNSSSTIEARRHDNMWNLFNEVADLVADCPEKYDKVMRCLRELKRELIESSVVCGSSMVSDTRNDSFSLGDVLPSEESRNILDSEALRGKGRLTTKRKEVVEKIGKKKRQQKKKTSSNTTVKEVENADGHVSGTQETVVNVNCYPSYMGQLTWPNMIPHNMQPNMVQAGTILPFSPTLCSTGIGFNQFLINFPTSQSNMPSLLNSQVWRGQSSIMGTQIWGGGQSSVVESQGEGWGGGQQSLLEMANARGSGKK